MESCWHTFGITEQDRTFTTLARTRRHWPQGTWLYSVTALPAAWSISLPKRYIYKKKKNPCKTLTHYIISIGIIFHDDESLKKKKRDAKKKWIQKVMKSGKKLTKKNIYIRVYESGTGSSGPRYLIANICTLVDHGEKKGIK